MNLPIGFLAPVGQGFKKILSVYVVQTNVLASITSGAP
jgi:hypothetical protein